MKIRDVHSGIDGTNRAGQALVWKLSAPAIAALRHAPLTRSQLAEFQEVESGRNNAPPLSLGKRALRKRPAWMGGEGLRHCQAGPAEPGMPPFFAQIYKDPGDRFHRPVTMTRANALTVGYIGSGRAG